MYNSIIARFQDPHVLAVLKSPSNEQREEGVSEDSGGGNDETTELILPKVFLLQHIVVDPSLQVSGLHSHSVSQWTLS